MVSRQVMLLYSSYSSLTRAVGVSRRWRDNGGDLSDLSASIVPCHIINVHLWEKPWPLPGCFCITLSFSLCGTFSLLSVELYLCEGLDCTCCILAVAYAENLKGKTQPRNLTLCSQSHYKKHFLEKCLILKAMFICCNNMTDQSDL